MAFLNHIFFIFLISLTTCAYSMDPAMEPPIERTYPLDFQPMKFADDPDDMPIIHPNPLAVNDDTATSFEGISTKDLETIFLAAPKKAQLMVKWLKDPEIMETLKKQPISFLVGDCGTGKTTLAKAIAFKLCVKSPWKYEYISSRAFMGKYRHQTGVCLRSYLEEIKRLEHPTVLIIDQLNKILEYTNSSSDDTSLASNIICNFIDYDLHNKNIFFLGLMDRATKLDKRLKGRMMVHHISIPKPMNPELRRIIFTSKCIRKDIQLDKEVTDEWLTHFLQANPEIIGYNYRGIALEIHKELEKVESKKQESITITKDNIESATKRYLESKKQIYYVDPYENYWDKTERIHTEGLFQKLVSQNQLPLLKQMLDNTDESSFFTEDQCILLRQMLELHNK